MNKLRFTLLSILTLIIVFVVNAQGSEVSIYKTSDSFNNEPIIIQDNIAINNKTMEIPSLKVGPNPVKQGQSITVGLFNEYNDQLSIQIVDLQGKVVMEQELDAASVVLEELSTSNLKQGMYLLHVHGNRLKAVRRIIIQ